MALEFRNVRKSFQSGEEEIEIFKNISFSIQSGEWISLMGPSGAGKSTLLKMLYGIVSPDTGKIFIEENEINSLNNDDLHKFRRENISFIFQDFKLLQQFNVIENVMLPLLPYSDRHKLLKEARDVLNRVGLKDKILYSPNRLSGGEKQRVAIARSLITKPNYLLCDEPTGNLDTNSRDVIMDMLKELNESGITIIVVTHDKHVAQKSNRIYMIEDQALKEVEL